MNASVELEPERWADHIESRRQEFGIPCIAAGAVNQGELTWCQGFGETEIGNGIAPNADSRFRIASNTKPFTATALAVMEYASMLTLEDPLMLHVPDFTSASTPVGDLEDITLRRLATHHSGLVTEHPETDWSQHDFPVMARILETTHDIDGVIPPDSAWKYSNLAYGLLGEVIERLSGKPYRRWISDEILEPLSMSHTVFAREDVPGSDQVVGYLPERPGHEDKRVAPHVDLNGIEAAGGMWSSVNDLSKWIAYMMSDDASQSGIQLSERGRDSLLRPAYVDARWNRGQCVGWRAERIAGAICHGHGGGIHGFGTATLWCKAEQVGVIVLTSLWPGTGAGQIARELMEMALSENAISSDEPDVGETDGQQVPDSQFSHLSGKYFAEPGLWRTVAAFPNGDLDLGSEESGLLGKINAYAKPCGDGGFVARNGRAAGETIRFADDLSFVMSNFKYERVDNE